MLLICGIQSIGSWDPMWKRFIPFNVTLQLLDSDASSNPYYELFNSIANLNRILHDLSAKQLTRREFHHHITTYHPVLLLHFTLVLRSRNCFSGR